MEINRKQLDQIINDAIKSYMANAQYGVTKIPAHSHNGIDSPKIDFNVLSVNKGYLSIPNLSADPVDKPNGAIAIVSGKLKICDGTNWIIVGTQS